MFQPKQSGFAGCTPQTYAAIGVTLLCLLAASIPAVQSQNAPNLRKLVYKVAPKYPPELKQNEIGGIVRLAVVINPNGSVAKISPVGGNPVLVDAATVAVKQWKYAASDHQTTTEVQLDFIPH
ncbi:MAG: TonB family protein [Terriglobales bacterium]